MPRRYLGQINWAASNNKRRFHYPPDEWDANVVFDSAQVAWEARTATARIVSDPAATSPRLFAEVVRGTGATLIAGGVLLGDLLTARTLCSHFRPKKGLTEEASEP